MRAAASSWRGRGLALRGVLLALALVVYGPHLGGDFVWDDAAFIRDEPRMLSPDGARRLLTEPCPLGGGVYRPASTLSYRAQAQAHGMSMPAFRAVNLGLHAGVAQALVSVMLALGLSLEAALAGAALATLHPGATEGVMFITARHDTLGTLCALLALRLALVAGGGPRRRALTALGAGLATLAAMSAKEVFALTPALLALAALLPTVTPGDARARVRRAAELAGAAAVFVAAALLWRRHLGVPTANALTGAPAGAVWRNVTGALAHYVPLTLRGAQGPTVLAWRPPSTATAALWSALVPAAAAALYALRRRAPATAERLGLGLVWLAAFAASSALAAPATGQHANRYLYPAIAGASLAVGAALDAVIAAGPRARRVALAAVAAVLTVFAAVSARQAPRWQSGLALFGADLPAGRDDARVLYHYGVSLARRDGCAAALPYFRRAAAIEPGYARAWHNVTGCLLQLGRAAEAIEPGRRALRLAPYDISCALNLGAAYALSGDRARADAFLRRGCAARPGHPACRLLPGR